MVAQKPKLYIVLYSLYHHVYQLAKEIAEGAEAGGCQVRIFQVEETLSDDILEKMSAPDRPNLPIISPVELAEADGILFGLPTRFGMFPTQVKTLLDATGSLWLKNGLAQKFAGFFISTASSHGGSETTALTAVSYLVHHAINYIPFGYANPALFDNTKVIGGTPYGSSTIANGDGSRQPSTEELELAFNQGENFGKILAVYHRGLQKLQLGGDVASQEDVSPDTSKPSATAGEAGVAAISSEVAKKSNKSEARPSTDSYGGEDSFYGSVMGALSSESSGMKKKQLPAAPDSHQQAKDTEKTTDLSGRIEEERHPPVEIAQPQQTQPTSLKKKLLWFCCGNDNDLD